MGSIVADFITTGILNANLIKTGILRSYNNLSYINMQDGTFNLANKIKFEDNQFSVDLSNEGLATEEQLKSEIRLTNEEISKKVSNNTFESYERQTAEEFSRKVAKGEEFSTELNQNTEEFNFNIGREGLNVKINKNGMDINNGALTVTNANGSITIDASKLMLRILTYGQGSVVIPNGSQTASVTITHNLRYNPVFKGQIGYINPNGETEYYSDALSLFNTSNGTVNYNARMFVNQTELKVVVWRNLAFANSGSTTFYYRYFIEEGVNL